MNKTRKEMEKNNEKPYIVSQDTKSGAWYCHHRLYPNIPVFGSVGEKKKAQSICRDMNRSNGW